MFTSFLEIVKLNKNEFALRRTDDQSSPLVKISFSQETLSILQDNDINVVKAMIAAGIEAAGVFANQEQQYAEEQDESASSTHRVLH